MILPGVWLAPGDEGLMVKDLQRTILCRSLSGFFDESTQARLRGWQLAHGLAPTGVVDDATAEVLGWKE